MRSALRWFQNDSLKSQEPRASASTCTSTTTPALASAAAVSAATASDSVCDSTAHFAAAAAGPDSPGSLDSASLTQSPSPQPETPTTGQFPTGADATAAAASQATVGATAATTTTIAPAAAGTTSSKSILIAAFPPRTSQISSPSFKRATSFNHNPLAIADTDLIDCDIDDDFTMTTGPARDWLRFGFGVLDSPSRSQLATAALPDAALIMPQDDGQEARQSHSSSTRVSTEAQPARHVRYNLTLDTENLAPPPAGSPKQLACSDTDNHREMNFSPMLRRRMTRTQTFKPVEDYDDLDAFDTTFSARPGWQPGSEPGFDPALPDGGHASMPALSAPCDISVIDFAHTKMVKQHFENEGFIEFLNLPKPSWAKCRWININGLSWDVIQAVGTHKNLHKLALEDIMNIRNRTKADWYPNHAFIILTLQKLVHLVEDDDDSTDTSSTISHSPPGALKSSIRDLWNSRKASVDPEKNVFGNTPSFPAGDTLQETGMIRTLQRYHSSSNEARTEFMESHSSLTPYKMAISAEQVSIFLTNDNTVISFFEVSAGDVERPIVTRLDTPGTILRESNDASLLVQAIIDAITDLALPLTAVYTDIISDIELDVLTAPSIKQSKQLYICISEINKMLSFLNPIDNLVNVLRDHKTFHSHEQAMKELENPASGVIITPMTHTYLGDVLDHCIMITEAMQQLKQSSENLISLIFNTISSGQNESMKQLTTVTIIFLPLTFITGFFGQNFDGEGFPDIHHPIWYFWACAVPTVVVTILVLMREMIHNWLVRFVQRKHIGSIRKRKKNSKRTPKIKLKV